MTSMRDVAHTNPHTGETFVATFQRGVTVAADGGERGAGPEDEGGEEHEDEQQEDEREAGEERTAAAARNAEEEVMEDVAHESETEGANRSFERGTEGKEESV